MVAGGHTRANFGIGQNSRTLAPLGGVAFAGASVKAESNWIHTERALETLASPLIYSVPPATSVGYNGKAPFAVASSPLPFSIRQNHHVAGSRAALYFEVTNLRS